MCNGEIAVREKIRTQKEAIILVSMKDLTVDSSDEKSAQVFVWLFSL
jgi:hypothetical protein